MEQQPWKTLQGHTNPNSGLAKTSRYLPNSLGTVHFGLLIVWIWTISYPTSNYISVSFLFCLHELTRYHSCGNYRMKHWGNHKKYETNGAQGDPESLWNLEKCDINYVAEIEK